MLLTMTAQRQAIRWLGKLVRSILTCTGIGLFHLGLAPWIIQLSPRRMRVLLYHAVENQPNPYLDGLNITIPTQMFEQHMAYVSSHYTVLSTDQCSSGRCPLMITFDDGYASVQQNALPILEARGLPATVYLIGKALAGAGVWVNELNFALNRHPRAVRQLLSAYPELVEKHPADVIRHIQHHFMPDAIETLMQQVRGLSDSAASDGASLFLQPEDIERMHRRGFLFGFHTQDHYNLLNCSPAELAVQLDKSTCEHLLNSDTFAYPFGISSPDLAKKIGLGNYSTLMTVGMSSCNPALRHTGRTEVRGNNAAEVFAQLEIEEPVMALLNSLRRKFRLCVSGSVGMDREWMNNDLKGESRSSLIQLETRTPKTSKPR